MNLNYFGKFEIRRSGNLNRPAIEIAKTTPIEFFDFLRKESYSVNSKIINFPHGGCGLVIVGGTQTKAIYKREGQVPGKRGYRVKLTINKELDFFRREIIYECKMRPLV